MDWKEGRVLNFTVYRGGCKISLKGGDNPPAVAPTYKFAKFSKKLHEIENFLDCSGARRPPPPLIRQWFTEKFGNSSARISQVRDQTELIHWFNVCCHSKMELWIRRVYFFTLQTAPLRDCCQEVGCVSVKAVEMLYQPNLCVLLF